MFHTAITGNEKRKKTAAGSSAFDLLPDSLHKSYKNELDINLAMCYMNMTHVYVLCM